MAASGQITAASLCDEGAPLSSIRPWKLASAASGSHLIPCGTDGCTRRSQVSVGRVGSKPSRIVPAETATRTSSAAATAGAARRARLIGVSDVPPSNAGSEAASTVRKLSPYIPIQAVLCNTASAPGKPPAQT